MYSEINFKTKKELKEAVASGKKIRVYQPNSMFPIKSTGTVTVEGPHYPQPHKWYAVCEIVDMVIVKVK